MPKVECCSCEELVDELRLLPCLHRLCELCFEDLLKEQVATSCPLCHEPVSTNTLTTLPRCTQPEAQLNAAPSMCERHPDVVASVGCQTCFAFFCLSCPQEHGCADAHIVSLTEVANLETNAGKIQQMLQAVSSSIAEVSSVIHSIHNRNSLFNKEITVFVDQIAAQVSLSAGQENTRVMLTQLPITKQFLIDHVKEEHSNREKILSLQLEDLSEIEDHGKRLIEQCHSLLATAKSNPVTWLKQATTLVFVSNKINMLSTSQPALKPVLSDTMRVWTNPAALQQLVLKHLEPSAASITQDNFHEQFRKFFRCVHIHDDLLSISQPVRVSTYNFPTTGMISTPIGTIAIAACGVLVVKLMLTTYEKVIVKKLKVTNAMISAMAVSAEGDLWLADVSRQRLWHIPGLAANASTWNSTHSIPTPSRFIATSNPAGVALLSCGNICCSDSLNRVIHVYSTETYHHLYDIGKQAETFGSPQGLAVLSTGELVVADYSRSCVQLWSRSSTTYSGSDWHCVRCIGDETTMSKPVHIAVIQDDLILVTESGNRRVSIWSVDGTCIHLWGSRGEMPGQFREPTCAVQRADGRIVVADIQKYAQSLVQVF